jgi:hypothetical protein
MLNAAGRDRDADAEMACPCRQPRPILSSIAPDAVSGGDAAMSQSVLQLARKFEALGTDVRAKFIFAGHGGWHASYGTIVVPLNTTISFYVPDGTSIGSDKSLDVDRGEFDGAGRLKRADGSILPPVDVYRAGDTVKNYVLQARNRLDPAQQTNADRTSRSVGRSDGAAVIGRRSFDMRYGNSSVDKRFITLEEGAHLFLSQIFADQKYLNSDIHWSACRVVM